MHASSTFHCAKVGFGISVGIFSIGVFLENILRALHVGGVWEWADNVVCGMLIGVVVFIYEKRQQKKTQERLRVIAEMNHHVRNALQPILYSTDEKLPHPEHMKLIRDSVQRIQWALAEILPGEFREQLRSEVKPRLRAK